MPERPTKAEVEKDLRYDPETGTLWRRVPSELEGNKKYPHVRFGESKYPAHHLAWLLMTGSWAGRGEIDHINRNKSDYRWANLRSATKSENAVNWVRKRRKFDLPRGVVKRRNKFAAYIGTKPGTQYLGLFNTPEEAHDAYIAAARERHGHFVPD